MDRLFDADGVVPDHERDGFLRGGHSGHKNLGG
jgi:hypothetical protein